MMKIATTLFLMFLTLSAIPQDQDFRLSINTGISVPVGKFAEKSLDGGSFAQTGWNVSMEVAWSFYKGLGAGLQAGYYAHPLDVATLASERVKRDPFLQELVIRSDPFRVITLAGFVQYSVNFAKQFRFTPRTGGGATLGFSPYQLYKPVYFLGIDDWAEKTSTRDWGPYFMAGALVQWDVSDCIALQIDAEYAYSRLVYSFLTGDGSIRDDIHQFMVLNILAGFSIKF